MKKLTNQELFDNAACGIISQDGKACLTEHEVCVVLNDDGDRCALGWSVTDATANTTSSPEWYALSLGALAHALRDAHDRVLANSNNFMAWQQYMSLIALKYNLDDSCVYWTKKEA